MASESVKKPQKVNISSSIVEANSPANQYLLQLLDDKKKVSFREPSEARIKRVFEVLEGVTPQLGLFSPLLTHIKDELWAAVYSPQLTGNPELKTETEDILVPVPYFSLSKRKQDERNEEAQEALMKLDQVTKRLLQSEEDALRLRKEVSDLQKYQEALLNTIASLEETEQKKEDIIKGLNEDLKEQAEKLKEEERRHKASVGEGQLQLQASHQEIHSLKMYRSRYQDLQHAFESPVEKKQHNVLSPVATKLPAERTSLIITEQTGLNWEP
ncbi:myosin heavy chain, clone 203-like [Ambystoma mexicanum]|uniref:myosin heavy chain, clone 203-like n=1 Tax=Ambystoma mexicanum TaxID=8296 RepID=UPI0037E7136F